MKQSPNPARGQFTLALHPEALPHLDPSKKEELLKVLSDLLLEAIGMQPEETQVEKEEPNEP